MEVNFWERLHGGSTHLPIVLVLVSVVIDFIAWRARDDSFKRALHGTGFGLAIAGLLGGCAAVTSGLFMTGGRAIGTGAEKYHHLCVWPAFGLVVVFVIWRLFSRGRMSRKGFNLYLIGMGLSSALMLAAGYWGGELLLGGGMEADNKPVSPAQEAAFVTRGHEVFVKHCAECHGDDALGTDDGPSLAGLRSNARIRSVVTNGIKGKMPRFAKKLRPEDVQLVIHFLRTVK